MKQDLLSVVLADERTDLRFAVFSEGDTADCTFDNLVIRKVSFDQ